MPCGRQFAALDAVGIGIEHKAVGIGALEQDHADIGHAVRAHRRQRHGIGVAGLGAFGFPHPALEQGEGIGAGVNAAIVQRSACLHCHARRPSSFAFA